jgi:hypothetical protein
LKGKSMTKQEQFEQELAKELTAGALRMWRWNRLLDYFRETDEALDKPSSEASALWNALVAERTKRRELEEKMGALVAECEDHEYARWGVDPGDRNSDEVQASRKALGREGKSLKGRT